MTPIMIQSQNELTVSGDSLQTSSFALESETWVRYRLTELVSDEKNLLKASLCLGVNPPTLRKVLSGKPLSSYIKKKLTAGLRKWPYSNFDHFQASTIRRLLSIYRLYQEKRSLAQVGREMGLSRERIRQLLQKGTKFGLFEYQKLKGLPLRDVPREKIIEDYKKYLQLSEVAKINRISTHLLRKLMLFHRISRDELKAIRIEGQKLNCLLQYYTLVKKFGYHPSTAELQKTCEGHYLSSRITQLWGSIYTFRNKLNIPSPKFKKGVKKAAIVPQ